MSPDINTEDRNRELDADILKGGEQIAGIFLRPISAGDLALLISAGVGIVMGRSDSIAFDVGAILYCQSTPRNEVREVFSSKEAFANLVYDFLDEYEPSVFEQATPRIIELVERMNKARTIEKGGKASTGKTTDPKFGNPVG